MATGRSLHKCKGAVAVSLRLLSKTMEAAQLASGTCQSPCTATRGSRGIWPRVLLATAWLSLVVGCTTIDLKPGFLAKSSPPKPKVPTRVVDLWTEEVLTEPNQPAVRGFAGRVMFYSGESTEPVAVDGTFSVFVFDESDRDTGYTQPERKFVYLPDQLGKYYSKSNLGHSYSFWLPWDEVGGPQRKLCLIARFEPRRRSPGAGQTLPPSAPWRRGPSRPGERHNAHRKDDQTDRRASSLARGAAEGRDAPIAVCNELRDHHLHARRAAKFCTRRYGVGDGGRYDGASPCARVG